MRTCCATHLAAKIRADAPNAENGAVTVTVIEDSPHGGICGHIVGNTANDLIVYCTAPAEFKVSHHPKNK